MRKLIVSNIVSLDGYYEGPSKNVMDLFGYRFGAYPADESFDAYNAERLRAADTLLGRTSYVGFKSYWPPVTDDPDAPPTVREISRLNNAIDKVVVSDGPSAEETEPRRNTRIVRRADAHERVSELKRQTGKDILVFGSRTL
jgi:dihydrofolate reductase